MRILMTVALISVSSSAWARSVFLNGVNIDGALSQKIENCTVEIDAQGNVHISASGYRVEQPGKALKRKYWLVLERSAPGHDQYDLEVVVNGKLAMRTPNKETSRYLEVTALLVPGKNTVAILAKKIMGSERKSVSPVHFSRIVLGPGDSGPTQIMIEKQLIDYRRTAAELKDMSDQFVVEVE